MFSHQSNKRQGNILPLYVTLLKPAKLECCIQPWRSPN